MIRGVLFDAGGVLIRPAGGRWNPRHDFETILARHHPSVTLTPAAIDAGRRFLTRLPSTAPREAYHREILATLGVADPSPALLHELEAPAASPVAELYPDVLPALDHLRTQGIRMSVVSDTWADTAMILDELGLAPYLAGYALSETLGCRKPDPRTYAEGARLLALPPPDCLFIDDDPALVAAARTLGYHGVTLDRSGRPAESTIATLHDLPPLTATE